MNAIGIGDLHLTSSLGKGGLAAYIKDQDPMVARAVIKALKWARDHQTRHVFLYGDVCDGTRLSYEGQLALLKILRLPFEFHIILGNHDLFSEDPTAGHSLQIIKEFRLPNVFIYEEPTVTKIDGRPVKFLPWPYVDFEKGMLNVFHNDVAGAKTDSGRPVTKGSESKALAVGGHIHTHQRVRNTHYSGTLYQTNFGEGKAKFFHHIEYDGGFVINSIPFKPEYTLHTVEVRTKKDLVNVPRSRTDLVKLILVDGCQISAHDTAGINIAQVKTANGARELALAKVEDLKEGSEVEVSTDEFFQEWLTTQSVESDLKNDAASLRTQLLKERHK